MKYLHSNKYWPINKDYDIDKLLYLMIDRPNIIKYITHLIWENNEKQWHRNYDLPSYVVIYDSNKTCGLCWDKDGKRHRENNKPADITNSGYKKYYINNKFIKDEWSE